MNTYNNYPEYASGRRYGGKMWDRVVCVICTGCGKPLDRYETLNDLAFWFDCRKILFPDTVVSRRKWKMKPPKGGGNHHLTLPALSARPVLP